MAPNTNLISEIEARESESAEFDFKSAFDPAAAQDWCELIKDIAAMANSGGGVIVIGVNDDGTPAAGADTQRVLAVDPAVITDKIRKYTDQVFAEFSLSSGVRHGNQVAVLSVSGVSYPIVFTNPGTYDCGEGRQKTAFSRGTVYFRHGAKSEPGTSDDLRGALTRELDRVRSSWMDGITKVVTAPIGATISVLPGEVTLSGAESATGVRLVNDENAPAFRAVRTDLLYPFRQKDLVGHVNQLLDGPKISTYDVHCVRKLHNVDAQPNFFYKPQFSSPQYSEAFAQWLVTQFRADGEFFHKTREECRRSGIS